MTVFVTCLVLMSVYCAQGQQSYAGSWAFGRSDVRQGDQLGNRYHVNNGQGVASASATSLNGESVAMSSSKNNGYDANGTYYEREVVEHTIGNMLYHAETFHWPSLEKTKIFRYTIDLSNPHAQPVWTQN